MLGGLKIPNRFIKLTMECVKFPHFTVVINGKYSSYFTGTKDLRQGDPMSPLLLVSCIDYFSRTFKLVGDN